MEVQTALVDKKEETFYQPKKDIKNITISLKSTHKEAINRAAKEFYDFVKEFYPEVKLPYISEDRSVDFAVRRSPCGNGTATFRHLTFLVHSRQFDLAVDHSTITRLVDFLKSSPVDASFKLNT